MKKIISISAIIISLASISLTAFAADFPVGLGDGGVYCRVTIPDSDCAVGDGTDAVYSVDGTSVVKNYESFMWEKYDRMEGYFPINTSAIGTSLIQSAKFYFYATDKTNTDNYSVSLYAGNQSSTSQLFTTDYRIIGNTKFSNDLLINDVAIGWNYLTLNSIGLTAINKTGWTKFGIKVFNSGNPTGINQIGINTSENAVYPPYLSVTTGTLPATKMDIDGLGDQLTNINTGAYDYLAIVITHYWPFLIGFIVIIGIIGTAIFLAVKMFKR